jgi:osmotically-inducible protein OsmY
MKRMGTITKCLLATILLLAFAACASTSTSRSTGTYVDDQAITAKVKAGLVANEETKAMQIKVETYRGVVQLSGFVDNERSKETAGKIAEGVEGVVDVKNDLIVRQ